MNELEQFIEILKEISSTIEKVNPAINGLTEGLISMVEKFSASESGIRTFIEIINIYVQTIERLSSGKTPVLSIPNEYIDQLKLAASATKEISSELGGLKNIEFDLSTLKSLASTLKEDTRAADDLQKALEEISKQKNIPYDPNKLERIERTEVTTTKSSGADLDVYGQELEKQFSGILERLRREFKITDILEEPRKLSGGVYRVVANQLKEEGEEAKRVAFYIDKLGNIYSQLAYTSKLTRAEIEELTQKYIKLNDVLKELGLTEENILSVRQRPDIGEDVVSVELGDEKKRFRRSVLVDTEGRAGFTKRELLGQLTEKQFNELLSKFPELDRFVQEHNLKITNLKNAYHNASQGVYEFKFAVADADGVVRKLTLKLDEQGRVALSTKEKLKEQTRALYEELRGQFPNIGSKLKDVFGDISDLNISKLSDGIFKVSGYKQVGDTIEKIVVYVDKLGNVQQKLSDAARVSRDEIGQLAVEYQHLRKAVFDYGYSLEDIKKIEKTAGGKAVKITLSNEDLGTLTLYADNLGRVATTLRGLERQLPTDAIKALTERFRDLNKELEKYGATAKDITGVRQFGNVTEITFTGKSEVTGLPETKRLYGDAQGRVFADARRASQLTTEDLIRVAATYENAITAAEQYGATLEHLIGIIQDEKTNISELVFAIEDANGKIKQFSVFTDEAGRVGFSKKDLGGRGFSQEELEKARQAYEPVIQMARKYGYELTDLKKIHTEASTGITRLTFAMKGEANEVRTLTLAIDKYGNILKDVQRKYQGFLDGIARNVVEATKWAVAIQLTYVPLQKLNELVDIAIDNQSKLADIAIGLGLSMNRVGGVFRDVADVASSTATPLNEALEGFSAAHRATAGLGNQSQRTAVALKLLRTSLILSKLASVDQAEAIDILVGALRQANIPLSESERILDKWIAVSKNAQVGINDLAEAYAVVGSAAINSGFDIDKLNGIIATLVESTPYTGKEVGNILRTFISNVQSSEAERQLNEVGIAVKDLNQEFRDFSEILDEISSKYSAGLIDDTKLKELARTLAGGSRRAAPFITMITQYGKALRTAEISNKAFGESQKALQIKLDTARSSITELANAFQQLSQTVGDKGGILDLFTVLTDSLTKIVELMDTFVSATGKAGVMLMTLLPLMGYLNRTSRMGALVSPVNEFLGNKFGYEGRVYTSTGWKQVPKYKITPNMAMAGITGAMILGSAAYDYATGDRNKKEEAVGSVVGAAIGGALSVALGMPQFITFAAAAGSAIGTAFVREVNSGGANSIAQAIADLTAQKYEENKKNKSGDKSDKASLEEQFFDAFWLRALGWIERTVVNISPETLVGEEAKKVWNAGDSYKYGITLAAASGMFGEERKQQAIELLKVGVIESRKLVSDDVKLENPTEPIEVKAALAKQDFGDEFTKITADWEKEISAAFNRGKISAAEYEKELERLSNLSTNLPSIYTNLGESLTAVGYKTTTVMEGLAKLSEIYIRGTDDEKERLASLLTELNSVNNEILKLQQQGLQIPVELSTKKTDLTKQIVDYSNAILQNIHVRNFKPPTVIREQEATQEDAQKIYERAKQKMEEYGNELVKAGAMTADEFQAFLKNLEDMFVEFNGGMMRVKGIERWAWDASRQELLKEGALSPGLQKSTAGFRIQSVDFTSARAGEFRSLVNYFTEYLKTNFPDYKLNEQDVGIIYQDYITDVLHADNLAIQMALNKMVELNQKQLDGIYNLPSNATFWVPYQAWAMQFNAQGGGALGAGSFAGTGKGEEEKPEEPKKDEALETLADAFKNGTPWWDKMPSDFKLVPKRTMEKEEPLMCTRDWMRNQGILPQFHREPGSLQNIPTSTVQEDKSFLGSIFDKLFGWLSSALPQSNAQPQAFRSELEKIRPKDFIKSGESMSKVGSGEDKAIAFNLELTSRQVITLDGAVIAQAVSKYIGSELLRTSRGGSINKSVEVV